LSDSTSTLQTFYRTHDAWLCPHSLDHFNQVPRHYTYGGKSLAFDNSCVIQSFFAACNSIHAHAKDLEEVVHVKQQKSYCLSILSYAAAAVKYTTSQEDEMNLTGTLFTDVSMA